MINRRQFLLNSGGILSGLAFSSLLLNRWSVANPVATAFGKATEKSADQLPDHLFVLVRTFGGMDVTLGLDPQVLPPGADAQDLFLEYRPEDILKIDGIQLGPAAKALAPWAKECLVVNGLMMRRDAGHDVINQYMITGRGDGKAATLPVELGLALGLSPFGVVTNSSLYLAGKPANISATQDVASESDQMQLIDWIEERIQYLTDVEKTPLEEAEIKMVKGKAAAQQIQRLLAEFKKENGKLEDRHILAAILSAGGAQQAQLDLGTAGLGLDTHSGHERVHLQAQSGIWNGVADLFALFKKTPYLESSLWDHTTFMVISEFSRTPALNPAKGKDHNPFSNSVLLAGKGIRKGTTVGKSRLLTRQQTGGASDHIAWPYDFAKQQFAEQAAGASFFYPENLVQTMGKLFGSPKAFTPVGATVPLIPGIIG